MSAMPAGGGGGGSVSPPVSHDPCYRRVEVAALVGEFLVRHAQKKVALAPPSTKQQNKAKQYKTSQNKTPDQRSAAATTSPPIRRVVRLRDGPDEPALQDPVVDLHETSVFPLRGKVFRYCQRLVRSRALNVKIHRHLCRVSEEKMRSGRGLGGRIREGGGIAGAARDRPARKIGEEGTTGTIAVCLRG